jgi:hypothetical protein
VIGQFLQSYKTSFPSLLSVSPSLGLLLSGRNKSLQCRTGPLYGSRLKHEMTITVRHAGNYRIPVNRITGTHKTYITNTQFRYLVQTIYKKSLTEELPS